MTNGLTNLATADERSSMPNATPTKVIADGDAEEEPAEAAMEVVGAVATDTVDADGIIEAAEVVIPIPQMAIILKRVRRDETDGRSSSQPSVRRKRVTHFQCVTGIRISFPGGAADSGCATLTIEQTDLLIDRSMPLGIND